MKIGLLGSNGFVGSEIKKSLLAKKYTFKSIHRLNFKKYIKYKFDIVINCSMPSKRFWAKKNPKKDYIETVNKTSFFLKNYKFKKFIHISSISARCEKNTVYGKNKKISEKLVKNNSNKNLIIRLGPMFGRSLKKGVLIDMLNSKTVFINGKSKYSFTNIKWIANWIIQNMKNKKGLIEIGSKDHIKLISIRDKIKSKSKFIGRLDNQIIINKEKYKISSNEVYLFLKGKLSEKTN